MCQILLVTVNEAARVDLMAVVGWGSVLLLYTYIGRFLGSVLWSSRSYLVRNPLGGAVVPLQHTGLPRI